jgi:hypothetical protein
MPKPDFSILAKNWPSKIVARTEIRRFSGGFLNEKTLANHDSQGGGPAGKFRIGRKVGYSVDSVIEWMAKRCTVDEE